MKEHDFVKAMRQITITPEGEKRVMENVMSYCEKKERMMMSKRKISVIAAAAVMAVGITVFAASGIITSWVGSSSSKPDYLSLPTQEECMEDVGYAPVLIDRFQNGYAFQTGSVVKNTLQDDAGNAAEKFKSFSFQYGKDGEKLLLSAAKYQSEMEESGQQIGSVDGIDLYYTNYTNKLVPGDYEMSEEEKQAQAAGELVFSYGNDTVELAQVTALSWEYEGIHYGLTQIDGALSAEELTEMAREIIQS